MFLFYKSSRETSAIFCAPWQRIFFKQKLINPCVSSFNPKQQLANLIYSDCKVFNLIQHSLIIAQKDRFEFSWPKTIKIARVRRTSAIWGLWKTHKCWQNLQNWVIRLRHVHHFWLSIFSQQKNICQNDRSKTMHIIINFNKNQTKIYLPKRLCAFP